MSEESTSTNSFENNYSYNLCKNSGTLDFWNDPEEDIYSFEDGEPINE